jgi:predicted dehydrogenase
MVTGSEGSVDADYMTQELKLIKKDRTIKPHYNFEEPLKRELKAFTESVEKEKDPPVSLKNAEQALRVAFAALNSAKQMKVVSL